MSGLLAGIVLSVIMLRFQYYYYYYYYIIIIIIIITTTTKCHRVTNW
jgi:hypothetical protein